MTSQDGYHDYGGDRKPCKVRLEEDDFNALVRGEVLKTRDLLSNRTIEIILADIGFIKMVKAVIDVRPQKRLSDEINPYWCECGEKYATIEEFIACRENHPTKTPPNKA